MAVLCAIVTLLFASLEPAIAAEGEERAYFWTQYVASGGVEVRAVVPGPSCPSVAFDGVPRPMSVRAEAPLEMKGASGKFPILVCAAAVPAGTRQASVSEHKLPLPKMRPQRIAILGDTGCRTPLEDCIRTWGLPEVAREIARQQPDLIIHLGDYLYRERGCISEGGCGYGWAPWRADFLDIAADQLFPVAPVIFVRGNHETCARAAKGWFMLFDPNPLPERCTDRTPAWAVDLGRVQLVILDTSAADDNTATDAAFFRASLASVPLQSDKTIWLLQHKPVWGMDGRRKWVNATLQAAFGDELAPRVSAVWSGHIHTTELLEIAGHPAQIILGNGGADLIEPIPAAWIVESPPHGAAITHAYTRGGYGFALLEEAAAGWRLMLVDERRNTVASCRLVGPELLCNTPK